MNTVHKEGENMPKILEDPKTVILSIAKDIILNIGIDKLTMREVSKKSGIAVGTIYNYFPTKKDLVIELVGNYWDQYLKIVEDIDKQNSDLYVKLHKIFIEMDTFIKTFSEVWIKDYAPKYSNDGIDKKNNFIEKLNILMAKILTDQQNSGHIQLNVEPLVAAKFLIFNFMTMSHMNGISYEDFEKIIRGCFRSN